MINHITITVVGEKESDRHNWIYSICQCEYGYDNRCSNNTDIICDFYTSIGEIAVSFEQRETYNGTEEYLIVLYNPKIMNDPLAIKQNDSTYSILVEIESSIKRWCKRDTISNLVKFIKHKYGEKVDVILHSRSNDEILRQIYKLSSLYLLDSDKNEGLATELLQKINNMLIL